MPKKDDKAIMHLHNTLNHFDELLTDVQELRGELEQLTARDQVRKAQRLDVINAAERALTELKGHIRNVALQVMAEHADRVASAAAEKSAGPQTPDGSSRKN
jgi:hypothetical protein